MDEDRPNLRALPAPPREKAKQKRQRGGPKAGTFVQGTAGQQPRFLEPRVHSRILQLVTLGASWTRAATAAGISHTAIYHWRSLAKEGKEPYVTFMAQIEEAEAQCEMRLLAMYNQAIPGDARGIERFLRTRFPDRWNPDRMEVIDVAEIELEEPITTVEHLSEVAAALEEAGITLAEEA